MSKNIFLDIFKDFNHTVSKPFILKKRKIKNAGIRHLLDRNRQLDESLILEKNLIFYQKVDQN